MMLSNRAKKALEMLHAGASFACRLERNYYGVEKWCYRLMSGGKPVHGYGFATFNELKSAGLLAPAGGGTSVSSYYKAHKPLDWDKLMEGVPL